MKLCILAKRMSKKTNQQRVYCRTEYMDLGFYVHRSLKVGKQVEKSVNKTNEILGIINISTEHKSVEIIWSVSKHILSHNQSISSSFVHHT